MTAHVWTQTASLYFSPLAANSRTNKGPTKARLLLLGLGVASNTIARSTGYRLQLLLVSAFRFRKKPIIPYSSSNPCFRKNPVRRTYKPTNKPKRLVIRAFLSSDQFFRTKRQCCAGAVDPNATAERCQLTRRGASDLGRNRKGVARRSPGTVTWPHGPPRRVAGPRPMAASSKIRQDVSRAGHGRQNRPNSSCGSRGPVPTCGAAPSGVRTARSPSHVAGPGPTRLHAARIASRLHATLASWCDRRLLASGRHVSPLALP